MDTGKYIILLLIGCMLVSCTKEITTIIPTPGEEEVTGKTSIRIVFDQSPGTRSGWEYDDYFPSATPTDEESKVSNVLLIIFKNIFLDEFHLYPGNRLEINGNTITLLKEKENITDPDEPDDLDLDSGTHFFYAVLNIPDGLYEEIRPKLENGLLTLTMDEFEKQVMEVNLEYLKGEGEGQNGAGFIMTNSTPPKTTVIYRDTENNVTIPVGRALAKVSLAYTPVRTGELHGRLTDIKYKTVNHPSRMYLMPVIDENGTLLTPHYTTTNFPTGYFINPAKDVSVEDGRSWLIATTERLHISSLEPDYDYCIENNVKKHLKSNSTGLIIRAQFHPVTWNNPDGTIGDPNDDGTFWRIVELEKNSSNILTYLQGYYNDEPDLNALGLSEYATFEYPNGICYYPFWLRTDGEHLVRRNAFHKIAITHVHGAGAPDIGNIVEPDVDPDDKATYGQLYIDLANWEEHWEEVPVGENPGSNSDNEGGVDIPGWEENPQEEGLEGGDDKNKFE